MPHALVGDARLHYEEYGSGSPILCVHGTGSAGFVWAEAAEKLAPFGRVIVYDRRGFGRSPRTDNQDVTTVPEHGDDARALLEKLDAIPAVVVGRSYGGSIALDLALRYPEVVRALVLLEAVPFGISTEFDAWALQLTEKLERAASERGIDAVAETMLREAVGEWERLPSALRELFTSNSAAMLAETRGGELVVDRDQLAVIDKPTLVVSAAGSPPVFAGVADALATSIPTARAVKVAGGHLIDPAGHAVQEFMAAIVERGRT